MVVVAPRSRWVRLAVDTGEVPFAVAVEASRAVRASTPTAVLTDGKRRLRRVGSVALIDPIALWTPPAARAFAAEPWCAIRVNARSTIVTPDKATRGEYLQERSVRWCVLTVPSGTGRLSSCRPATEDRPQSRPRTCRKRSLLVSDRYHPSWSVQGKAGTARHP